MSVIRIGTHKLTIKPFYKGYIIENEISKKEKIILLRKLYFYYQKMSQNNEVLQIDDGANIDEALFYLFSQFADDRFNDYEIVLEGSGIDIGKKVDIAFDSGVIPLRAFHEQRKNKPFYNFLERIIGFLGYLNVSIFNDHVSEMAIEEMENKMSDSYFDDDEADVRLGFKTNKYLIEPIIEKCKNMRLLGIEFKNNEFKKYATENPKWAEFIMDFKKVWKDGDFAFHHIAPLNIDEGIRDEGYLDLDSMFHFGWDYRYVDIVHPIDQTVDYYKHSQSGNGYWAEPYVTINSAKGKYDKNHLKKEEKRCTNLLNLFLNYYDCFDYKQR